MRTSSEVKDMVQEIKNGGGFIDLHNRANERYAQLYRRPSYVVSLTADLDPSITTRIPLPSKRPSIAARQTAGIMRASYQWHVATDSEKAKQKGRADALEIYFAHLFTTKFDRGGRLFGPTRRDQAVSPFALWWLEHESFVLPEDGEKREDYRKRYDPFNLYRINPLTGYFLPDDAGRPTVAAREFSIPYIEVAKRYGKGEDRDPLVILQQQFPGLRGAQGKPVESSDLGTMRAKVCVLDDGQTIAHYIDIKGTGAEYIEAFGETPNPWGRPSLFVIPGSWNPDAVELVDQYLPVLDELFVEQRNLDVMRSHMASLAFTPNKFGQSIPPEIAAMLISEDKPVPAASFKDGIATLLGRKEEFGNQPGQAAWELLAGQLAERDAALPPPFLTNPDESVIKHATLGAQLNAHETSNRLYDDPREALISQIVEVCDAIKHFWTGGYAGVAGESVYFRPSGREPVTVNASEYRDKELILGQDAWEMDYTLEVSQVAFTNSQKALEYELKKQQVMDGAEEHEALIAVHTENVTSKKLAINADRWFQKYAPVVENLTMLNTLQGIETRDKVSLIPLAIQTGVVNPMLLGPQGDGNIGGARTDPPATAVPETGVTG